MGDLTINLLRATWAVVCVCVSASCGRPNGSDFIRVRADRIAVTHVTVVDGTGSPAKADQTVLIERDRIAAIGPTATLAAPAGSEVLDGRGSTVIPGLVGMHDHLFYATDAGLRQVSLARSFARLYLAAGVTTIRTAGTIDLEKDIEIKRQIDAGVEVGPKIHLSSPYIGAARDLQTLIQRVETAADAGVTSLKVYMNIRRHELGAAIAWAHSRGLKITGHLCAVGFRDAAALGIDNLEHGLIVDTEFYSRKVSDRCPDSTATVRELAAMSIDDPAIQETIGQLVNRRVAVTSTLAVFETVTGRAGSVDARMAPLLSPRARLGYEIGAWLTSVPGFSEVWERALGLEMAFERRFVAAGGLLMAGADPTGGGGVLAGLADHRNVELLVESGFSPERAIQIATANGATFLDESARIGTLAPGKQADMVLIRGNLVSDIRNIRNVEIVFKDGVGLDAARLMQAEHGHIGASSWKILVALGMGPILVLLLVARRRAVRRRPPKPRPVL